MLLLLLLLVLVLGRPDALVADAADAAGARVRTGKVTVLWNILLKSEHPLDNATDDPFENATEHPR